MTSGLMGKWWVAVLLWVGGLGCASAPVLVESPRDAQDASARSDALAQADALVLALISELQAQSEADSEPEPVDASEPPRPLAPLPGPPRASNFLVLGGGGEPSNNEIALEKNVRYFQRTLRALGLPPESATVLFANGGDGAPTVRYLGEGQREHFKALEIPHLQGPATLERFLAWVDQSARRAPQRPVFIYFTGHGGLNRRHKNNNHLLLWEGDSLTVRAFGLFLERLPSTTPVVAVMAQCYAGSFAHFIHQDAHPGRAVVAQPRCGFFATVESMPSVGCTPEVDEADYRDYSSSFFAGLSGVGRTGGAVASADYDGDGRVSYAEAHAFAKVDGETTDLPLSTSEAWLRRRASARDKLRSMRTPLQALLRGARPEQRHVVEGLADKLGFTPEQSWKENIGRVVPGGERGVVLSERLHMELLTLVMQQKLAESGSAPARSVHQRLVQCEGGSWEVPPGGVSQHPSAHP